MKYDLYIGRWQPFHLGHFWLINQSLEKGNPVCIAVRDVAPDEQNPMSPEVVVDMLREAFKGREDVVVILIPDITSVNYGRGVGYEIIEHIPPPDIKAISATEIRNKLKANDESWKDNIYPTAISFVEQFFRGE